MTKKVPSNVKNLEDTEKKIKTKLVSLKGWVAMFLVFVISLTLGLGGYELYNLKQVFAAYQKKQTELLTTLSKSTVWQINTHKRDIEEKIYPKLDHVQTKVNALSKQVGKIYNETSYVWELYEVQHLLRLSSFYSQFYDLKTAVSLLDKADKIVHKLNLPKLAKLRAAFAQDKVNLSAIEEPDFEGIWFMVEGLIKKVPQLSLEGTNNRFKSQEKKQQSKTVDVEHKVQKDSKVSYQKSTVWQRALQSTWSEMKNLVTIRRHKQPIKQLMSQKEQCILQQEFVSILEQVRSALMRREPSIYHSSVLRAKGFLLMYFRVDDLQTNQIVSVLEKLSNVNVCPKIPELSQSLVQMERAITLIETGKKL